jgi:5-methylcytosine-specific restriction endonuclease McrA
MKSKNHSRIRGHQLNKIRNLKMMEQPLCVVCLSKGRTTLGQELDHIVPISKGGSNEDSNLQMLCSECHYLKTLSDMGYKPKPKIGLDGWIEDESSNGDGVGQKSKANKGKTGLAPFF